MSFELANSIDHVTVVDGGWSSLLHAQGAPYDRPAELANLTHAHLVEKIARDYLAAGAQLITTNTFGCSVFQFEARHVDADPREVARAGVAAARRATGRDVPLLGVIGPSGKIMAIREVADEALQHEFQAQARTLAEAGVDAIVLETFSELEEITIAIRAVKEATRVPVIACMSFDSGPQRTRTRLGVTAEAAAPALEAAGADAVGSNCGGGAASALPAVAALRAATRKPIWVKPSIGLPELEQGRPVYTQTPDEFGTAIAPLLDAGVNFIGGCCGVGPEHIRRLAHLVEAHRRKAR